LTLEIVEVNKVWLTGWCGGKELQISGIIPSKKRKYKQND